MNGIEGVEITVFVGDAWPVALEVGEDGYLGRLKSGMLAIVARVASGQPIFGVGVDGKKNVHLLKDRATDADPPVEYKVFRAHVQMKYGEGETYVNGELRLNNVFFTRYPQNNLRLLKLEPTGEFHIWETAVISQNGDFFLTTQETYSGSCYRSDDGLACPKLGNWPQMIQLMADIIQEAGLKNLPELITYSEDTLPPWYTYEGNYGVVLWWNHAMGMGVIQTSDGQARVHWTQVPKRTHLAFLKKGERVTFAEIGPPVVKPRPDGSVRPTTFKLEAKGIQLAS